jgi:integrase
MYYTTTTASTVQPTVKQGTPFLPLFIEIKEQIEQGKVLTPDGNKYSPNTSKNYATDIKILKLFEQETETIFLEDISIKWATDFNIWMMDKEYSKNTIAGTLQRIKAVLRRLKQEGKGTFDGSGIRAATEETTAVFNTIEEIKVLLEADFADTPGYDRVRDIYVIHCFLGLRFSDLSILLENPKNFLRDMGGKLYFEIKTQKTGEIVFIPISRTVKQVCERYQWNFGEIFSYQYYNEAIKEIAKRAGITENIVYSRTEGGKRIDTIIPKYELMSSHTARRTFATNAHLSGLSERDIMMITGHKTTTSFYRYIRSNPMQSAIKIANHDFFNIDMPVTISLPQEVKQELKLLF